MVPAWFSTAMQQRPRIRTLEVAGANIVLRIWGRPGDPGLVLVHGGMAHAGWWDHIGPHLATGRHVVALDLSGHGSSDHRDSYGPEIWGAEVAAAAELAGAGRPAAVVGHSMGGRISLVAAAQHRGSISALAMIDSPMLDLDFDPDLISRRRTTPKRVYPTLREAMDRFVTLPAQDQVLPYVRAHVAELSLTRVEGGWSWNFDPSAFGSVAALTPYVTPLACPVALFRCEHGIVPPEVATDLVALAGEQAHVIELPEMGHHPMLDRPLALIASLRTLLAAWGR